MTETFFELSSSHILMAVLGAIIFLAHWLARVIPGRIASSSALLMLLGVAGYAIVPGMPDALDPTAWPGIWEVTTEIVLIIVLFATGLRIDSIGPFRAWVPAIGLLAISMPITIAAVALLGWWLAGMTLAGAVVLGAALAPTDPVLAGDAQVGPPMEGREPPVRFALTTEAGLNDGLAFPFVYLGLLIAVHGGDPSIWLIDWLLVDVLWRISVGVILGAGVGWMLGKSLFRLPGGGALAQSGQGVIALAAVLLSYGIVELAEGYGFIGAFVAGLVCRRVEEMHDYHRRLHTFSESIEHAVTAILLILLGSTLPSLWPVLDWQHSVIGFGLLLVIRPLAGWLGLAISGMKPAERGIVAFFGVRGVGSVYYLAYASGHVEFVHEEQLWALVVFTIFASTVLHGATGFIIDRVAPPEPEARRRSRPAD